MSNNGGRHTGGPLVFEDKRDCGAGLQIKGVIGEPGSRREFAEFKLRGDVPVPLFLVAYDQWMQFPNPEWNEMQIANGHRLAACWNACLNVPTETVEAIAGLPGLSGLIAEEAEDKKLLKVLLNGLLRIANTTDRDGNAIEMHQEEMRGTARALVAKIEDHI